MLRCKHHRLVDLYQHINSTHYMHTMIHLKICDRSQVRAESVPWPTSLWKRAVRYGVEICRCGRHKPMLLHTQQLLLCFPHLLKIPHDTALMLFVKHDVCFNPTQANIMHFMKRDRESSRTKKTPLTPSLLTGRGSLLTYSP